MLVPAGLHIFFLREHRFAVFVTEAVVMDTVYTVIHVEYVFIAHILSYIYSS